MDEQTLVHLYNGMIFQQVKEMIYQAIKKTCRNLKCILLHEKSQSNRLHTVWLQLCDILEEEKLWGQQKDEWLSGVEGEGGINRWNTEDFFLNIYRAEKIFCVTVDTYHNVCQNPQNVQYKV